MNASPYMEFYVLEALCRMERYDVARQRMLQRFDAMIREDYSTLWENWSKAEGTSNHAWTGGPLVIMSKYFAGVRPVKAGYEEFLIQPQLTAPDTVRCVVPSVRGFIRVTERKTADGAFLLDASLPKGTTARIDLPFADGQTVTLNGSVIWQNGRFAGADGIAFVQAGNGRIVFSAACGEALALTFEVKNQ